MFKTIVVFVIECLGNR